MPIFSRPIPEMRICMMGPRAVGKTTVMTSIFADTINGLAGTGLFFRYKEGSESEKLSGYKNCLKKCISEKEPGKLPASLVISDFKFEVGYSGKVKTNILVKDYPGEYLTDGSKQPMLEEFLKETDVVIIAVDTPYLMEERGAYNEEKNHPDLVMDFIDNHPENFENKLILLVPLKCERYFHDKRIEDVADRVEKVYERLTKTCQKHNIACVIAPILTLGGIEFDSMETNKVFGISRISKYRMYEKDPTYKPLFCIQPIYYLMLYAANYNEWAKDNLGFWDRLRNLLANLFENDENFRTALREMRKNILYDQMGYRILNKNAIIKL